MKIEVKTQVGNVQYTMIVDEQNDIETLHKAIVLGNPPRYCDECKNNQYFKLDSNKDKEGNTYINVVCGKCYAKAKLGQYRAGGHFWHKFVKYVKGGQDGT